MSKAQIKAKVLEAVDTFADDLFLQAAEIPTSGIDDLKRRITDIFNQDIDDQPEPAAFNERYLHDPDEGWDPNE